MRTNEKRLEILNRISDKQWVEIIADGKDVMKRGQDARLYINFAWNDESVKNISVVYYNTCSAYDNCGDHTTEPNNKYCSECECELAETEWIGEDF